MNISISALPRRPRSLSGRPRSPFSASLLFLLLLAATAFLWFGGLAATTFGQSITNPSFETDASTGADPGPITGWPFTAGSGGISDSTQPTYADNGAIPDGTKVAFIHGAGTMHQVVSGFTPGLQYRLRYYENARACCGANTPNLQVTVDGVTVVAEHTVVAVGGTSPYVQKTTEPFTATAASLDLAFVASGTGDFTVLLDNVEIAKNLDVTNLGDTGPGSLRQTILDAPAGSTITFAPGIEGTVGMFAGKITIDKNLAIVGPGSSKLTLHNSRPDGVDTGAGWENRVLSVSAGATVTISGLSVTGGRTVEVSAIGFPRSGGAGIRNDGTLTLTDVTVSDCVTTGSTVKAPPPLNIGYGGGIGSFAGSLTLNNCTIANNQADMGGGVYAEAGGGCTINNSFITTNVANHYAGGGLALRSNTSNINNSTISDNKIQGVSSTSPIGGGGGGLLVGSGTFTLTNTTVSGNDAHTLPQLDQPGAKAMVGGGVLCGDPFSSAGAHLILINSTVTNNLTTRVDGGCTQSCTQSLGNGGGVYIALSGGDVTMRNSILAANLQVALNGTSSPSDYSASIPAPALISQGYNLIGAISNQINGTTTGNITGTTAAPVDPKVAPLGFYGGVTPTRALLTTSPAINAGNPDNLPATDQRGAARVGTADIGAFEVNDTANAGTYVVTLPQGVLTLPYSYTLVPNNSGFTYTVTSGALPAGITLTTSGNVISLAGTPTAAGTFDFTVTGSNGTLTTSTNYRIVVPANASVTAIDPPSGSVIGNQSVTITGANFTDATDVSIGGTPVISFTIVSDTSITAVTPAHGVGPASVAVAKGGSANGANALYTYIAALFTQSEYDGSYTSGQNSILNSPNTFNLYTLSQVQALNADVPLLTKDPATGKFKLTLAVKKTTNLVTTPFTDFPMNGAGMTTVINAAGQVEFVFPVSDNAAFFRVQAQ